MKVDGRCHCGHIAFEADIDPDEVELCNCTDCQTLHGSAFSIVVPVRADSFRLLSGEPTYYVKTADSGNQRRQAFCPRCGTRIYSGPAIVEQMDSTTLVLPGQAARVDAWLNLVIEG
jgi:hypothetical protein